MSTSASLPVTLTRRELYEQVWATPILKLAERYALSDVGLAKICDRYEIPRPARGYWAKRAFGKAPDQPLLPPATDPQLDTVILVPKPEAPKPDVEPVPAEAAAGPREPTFEDQGIAELYKTLSREHQDVRVPAALRSPLPIVTVTLSALKRAEQQRRRLFPHRTADWYSPDPPGSQACLDVRVTRLHFERAMRFLDTLLKTFHSCGFSTRASRDGYSHTVRLEALGERFRLGLEELSKKVPHTPTTDDLKNHEMFGTRIPKTERVPSGQLCLTLAGDEINQPILSWADGDARRIEDRVPEVVCGILERVDRRRTQRRAEAAEARRCAEEAHRKYLEEQRRKEEQARVDDLLHEVDRWERARRIRRYLHALERAALERHGRIEEDSEMGRWLQWARGVADLTDPVSPYRRTTPATPAVEPHEGG